MKMVLYQKPSMTGKLPLVVEVPHLLPILLFQRASPLSYHTLNYILSAPHMLLLDQTAPVVLYEV